jgi:hypothetical protein
MLLRKILRRAGEMCEPAYLVQEITALTALALMIYALICFLSAEEWNADTYHTLLLARELFRTSSGILFVGIIAAVCIEEIHSNPV